VNCPNRQQAKGYCPDGVHSDQMVLIKANREAGPCKRWSKSLKGEVENNSRKPRDLVGNWHDKTKKVQLTLAQGKIKKGDAVAEDEDDDAENQCVTRPSDSNTLH
jgi:hypothetical protein